MSKKRYRWDPMTEERKKRLLEKRANKKSLLESHPSLAKEWVHAFDFNGNIDETKSPSSVTRGSIFKVLWRKQCNQNAIHEWVAEIHNRATIGTGCPYCKKSTMESEMLNVLKSLSEELDIKLIQQGPYLKKYHVYPDFLLTLSNNKRCIIEMDGQQHFRPVTFGSKKDPNMMLKETQNRDHRKNYACCQENISIMRVDCTINLNDYSTFVKEFINIVNTSDQWIMICHGKHYDNKVD